MVPYEYAASLVVHIYATWLHYVTGDIRSSPVLRSECSVGFPPYNDPINNITKFNTPQNKIYNENKYEP